MTWQPTASAIDDLKPIVWLVVMLAFSIGGEARYHRQQKGALGKAREDLKPPSYTALSLFAACRLLGSLAYPVIMGRAVALPLTASRAHALYLAVNWGMQLLSAVCVFFAVPALLTNALSEMPEVAKPARVAYGWAAVAILGIGLTAHLPTLGSQGAWAWLVDTRISLLACIAGTEVCLLILLLGRFSRMGLYLRSRPIGLAVGLAVIGCADLVSASSAHLALRSAPLVTAISAGAVFFSAAVWIYYVILPEPERSEARLPTWKMVTERLGERHRPILQREDFMSRVDMIVESVLEKHHVPPMQ